MIQIYVIGIVALLYLWLRFVDKDEKLKEVGHKLRSLRVRFGKTFEHFIPFIKSFPGDREKTVFLGMPIDFIIFDKKAIKFVEVKTQNSKLSEKQEKIKKQIQKGQVEWHELHYQK